MKIVHDVHTHNVMSNCCHDRRASTEAQIAKEMELGNRVYGLSNHIWDESVPGASTRYRRQNISVSEECRAALKKERNGIRCLFGAETEYFGCTETLGMSLEGAKHFDYLLVPHSHLHMRNEVMADYPEIQEARAMIAAKIKESCAFLADDTVSVMTGALNEAQLMKYVPEMKTNIGEYVVRCATDNFLAIMENKEFIQICRAVPTSIAHPFLLCGFPPQQRKEYLRLLSDDILIDCFTKAKKLGVYVEINTGSVRTGGYDFDEMMRIFSIAKQVGCQFTFGTDAHSIEGLELIRIADDICTYLGLTRSDIAPYLAEDGVID